MLDHNLIVKESWGFFKENFISIVKFMLPIIIVTSLIGDIFTLFLDFQEGEESSVQWLTMYIFFLIKANLYALDVALFLHFIKNYLDDTGLNSKELLLSFIPRLPSLIILTTIAASFIFLGLILMIFPGIYIAFRLSFAWMHLIFDRTNPIMALFRSFKETQEPAALMAKALAVVLIPFLFFVVFYTLIASSIFNPYMLAFTLSMISSIIFLFVQVILFRIYSQYGHESS